MSEGEEEEFQAADVKMTKLTVIVFKCQKDGQANHVWTMWLAEQLRLQ